MARKSKAKSERRAVAVSRPRMDLYTVLLMLALAAIVAACFFLFLEIQAYGGRGAIKGPPW